MAKVWKQGGREEGREDLRCRQPSIEEKVTGTQAETMALTLIFLHMFSEAQFNPKISSFPLVHSFLTKRNNSLPSAESQLGIAIGAYPVHVAPADTLDHFLVPVAVCPTS